MWTSEVRIYEFSFRKLKMEKETKRGEILKRLEEFHKNQGVAFLTKKDAVDYFRGLTDLIYWFWIDGKQDGLNEAREIINK